MLGWNRKSGGDFGEQGISMRGVPTLNKTCGWNRKSGGTFGEQGTSMRGVLVKFVAEK